MTEKYRIHRQYSDTGANLEAIAEFLGKLNVETVELLPYHPIWKKKNRNIGIENPSFSDPLMNKWMNTARVEECAAIFKNYGIKILKNQ